MQVLKQMPGLQRRLVYLVCATTLLVGIYFVSTLSHEPLSSQDGKKDSIMLKALKDLSPHPMQQDSKVGEHFFITVTS